jgi:hypothetical protein
MHSTEQHGHFIGKHKGYLSMLPLKSVSNSFLRILKASRCHHLFASFSC